MDERAYEGIGSLGREGRGEQSRREEKWMERDMFAEESRARDREG